MYELAHAASGKGQRPMRRETTNAIRTVLEEVLPPFVRDSAAMRWLFRRHWGHLIRSEEHTSELPSLMRSSYAVFCLQKKNTNRYSPRLTKHKSSLYHLHRKHTPYH